MWVLNQWLIAGIVCLALCHAMPQPDPEPQPDVNVGVNVDINKPNKDDGNDINVDVNVNIVLLDGHMNNTLHTNGSNNTPAEYRPYCENCGKAGSNNRIVGGEEVPPGKWPWQVFLLILTTNDEQLSCGGSIIKKGWILTAAHCFYGMSASQLLISIGDHNVKNASETDSLAILYSTFDIEDYVWSHPNYNDNTVNNDIALIELKEDLVFTKNIQPVCLGIAEDIVINKTVVVTGWGLTEYRGKTSNVLLEVSVELIDWDLCVELYQKTPVKYSISVNNICTLTPGKDACGGDSGGPLVSQLTDGRWVQIGIVSFGYQCAFNNAPGVYTKISNYQDWIDETTRSRNCSSVPFDYDY